MTGSCQTGLILEGGGRLVGPLWEKVPEKVGESRQLCGRESVTLWNEAGVKRRDRKLFLNKIATKQQETNRKCK